MQIARHKVVTIAYTLTDDEGTVLDSSRDSDPLSFIQGTGNIIPGLESALEGKAINDAFAVRIPAEFAYGERDDSLMQVIPREHFEGMDDIEVGMRFQTPGDQGVQVVTVMDVTDDNVTIDANHPLAGVALNFDVAVVGVRDASQDEIAHGHVHGPGGHHHN